MRAIGKVLRPLVSETVAHAGIPRKRLPRGATAFKPDDYVSAVRGDPVIISKFYRTSPDDTERHLFVMNRSFAKRANTQLKLSGAVAEVRDYNAEGVPGDPYLPASRSIAVRMKPGAARLFSLQT